MSSIIEYFNANKLNYTASSTKPESSSYGPYKAFNKDGDYFKSYESPYYWQVSFSKPVSIESYIIRAASSWDSYTSSWYISYSNDGSTFHTIRTETEDIRTNTFPFKINPPINCKHFRITGRTVISNSMRLLFLGLDCFGRTGKKKTIVLVKRRFMQEILRILMQSAITT